MCLARHAFRDQHVAGPKCRGSEPHLSGPNSNAPSRIEVLVKGIGSDWICSFWVLSLPLAELTGSQAALHKPIMYIYI